MKRKAIRNRSAVRRLVARYNRQQRTPNARRDRWQEAIDKGSASEAAAVFMRSGK